MILSVERRIIVCRETESGHIAMASNTNRPDAV